MFGPPAAPAPAAMPAQAAESHMASDDSPSLSPEELDKVLAQPEPEAMGSIASGGPSGKEEKEEEAATTIEELPEPEPIPGALTSDSDDAGSGRKSWVGAIAAAGVVLVLLGGGAGLFFGRDHVMRMVPMTKEIYSMIGLGGEALGAGLDIRSVASERANEGGVEVLAVRGVIANISTLDRPVPHLRVALFDGTNRMVQSVNAAPAKTQLPPGGEIGFRVPLRDPSPLARRLEVTFIDADKSADGAPPGAQAPKPQDPAASPEGSARGAPGLSSGRPAPPGEPKGETKSGG
ncbi:MAG: DUF3426 domain-containing protein [Pseudomonadota bacterium]